MSKIILGNSDTDLDYPICRPSLDLDFTQEELDPRITFTRGSTATRVNRNRLIETVAANQPRFDYDPVTGECKGLLIEESRQNLFTSSNDFSVNWTKQTDRTGVVGITTNYTTSPDGTTNATRYFIQNGGGTFYSIYRGVSPISANTSYTYSVFVKASTATTFFLVVFDGSIASFVTYNLNTGTIQSTFANTNLTIGSGSTITNYGNGWYRCVFVFSHSVGGSAFQFKADIGSTRHNQELFIYGAQIEAGAFPTSYIPTTASTVTRSADLASMTGTNFSSWYNSNEGTVFANINMNGVQTGRYDRLWAITNSNLNLEGISLYVAGPVSSGGYVSSITITNSATEQINGTIVESANTTPKLRSAFAFKTNDCASAYNGALRFVDKSAILLSNPDRLLIGQPQRFQGTSCMTISRLTYYPRALKPNQLQLLTQ